MPYGVGFSFYDINEAIVAFLLLAYGLYAPETGRKLLITSSWSLRAIARRPMFLIVFAAVLPPLLRAALLPINPVPTPTVMEEFSHLLQADTYAHWRLYNPTHPLAVLIQGSQSIQWPHYMAVRPPLSGIFLFAGQVLTGSPFIGNLLSVALTSAALCWMMLEWLPRRWATIGTLLVILGHCLFGYWVNGYWCPTPNILGAAVILALVPRIERKPCVWHAVLFSLAMALLAGIRPYENGVYVATVLLWLGVRFLQSERRPMLMLFLIRFAFPVAIGGIAIIAGLGWYNMATTGNIAIMPYSIWRLAQCFVPPFLWQPISHTPLVFYDPGAAKFAKWEVLVAQTVHDGGFAGIAELFARHVVTLRDQVGPMLLLPLLCWSSKWLSPRIDKLWIATGIFALFGLLLVSWSYFGVPIQILLLFVLYKRWVNKRERLAILLLVTGLMATSLSSFYMNVYFAAFMPPLILLSIGGLQYMTRWNKGHGAGMVGMILIGAILFTGLQVLGNIAGKTNAGMHMTRFDEMRFDERDTVLRKLSTRPGRQLIMVRNLAPGRTVSDLVWNGANVDKQNIIWARDLKPEWTAAAIDYWRPREIWLVEMLRLPEKRPSEPFFGIRLSRYPMGKLPKATPLAELPMPDRDVAISMGIKAP